MVASSIFGDLYFCLFHPFSLADGGSVTCELNVGLIAPQSEEGREEASLVHLREPGSGKCSHFVAHYKIAQSPITRYKKSPLQDFKLFIIGEFSLVPHYKTLDGGSARENTQNIKKTCNNSDLSDIGAFPQLSQGSRLST